MLVVHGTTRQLAKGNAIPRDFPGGYKDVLQYFKAANLKLESLDSLLV